MCLGTGVLDKYRSKVSFLSLVDRGISSIEQEYGVGSGLVPLRCSAKPDGRFLAAEQQQLSLQGNDIIPALWNDARGLFEISFPTGFLF